MVGNPWHRSSKTLTDWFYIDFLDLYIYHIIYNLHEFNVLILQYIYIYHASCSMLNSIIILNNHQHLSKSHVYFQHQISSFKLKNRLLKVLKLQVNLQPSRSLPGEGMCWGPTDLGFLRFYNSFFGWVGLKPPTIDISYIYIYITPPKKRRWQWKNNTI